MTLDQNGGQCRCGNKGCLELYAGGAVILSKARQAGAEPADLAELVDDAVGGDLLAKNLIKESGEYIGVALGGVVNVYGPDRILIGGELSAAGDILLDPIRASMAATAMPIAFAAVDLGLAKLRSFSTALGAAAVVLRSRASAVAP
jgi:predicted NBD/HSP70 family sugar kinase